MAANDPDDAQAKADRAALERLYGPQKKDAKTQSWTGVALLVLGPVLAAVGGGMEEPAMIAVGVVALAVGVWATLDGFARARRAKDQEE